MRIIFSITILLFGIINLPAQWSPNFSVNGKGISDITNVSLECQSTDPTICPTYDVSGMNWYLTGVSGDPFNFQFSNEIPPQHNYAKAVNGQFWTQDPDGDICITSPILNIASLGTITASYTVFRSGDCAFGSYSSPGDEVYSSYSINGGPFVNSALFTGICGSTSIWSQNFSGNTAVVRLCMDANSVNEDYSVLGMSVNLGTLLPVKWSGFFISPTKDKNVQLTWQTSSEVNNHYFDVERSLDGHHFSTIGSVEGSGNRSTATNYQFVDKNTVKGNTYYYRIKQVDYDGTADYSVILDLKVASDEFTLTVSPNPVDNMLSIEMNGVIEKNIHLEIYNMNGQNMRTILVQGDQNMVETDISDLPPGTYYISSHGVELKPLRFIKIGR